MSPEQIIRAWKDEAYRNSLSEAEAAKLPGNPAGLVELTDEEAGTVAGGWSWLCSWLLSCYFTCEDGPCDITIKR
jgi:mersacidin/lichenicidin family type 2 lantibiotic